MALCAARPVRPRAYADHVLVGADDQVLLGEVDRERVDGATGRRDRLELGKVGERPHHDGVVRAGVEVRRRRDHGAHPVAVALELGHLGHRVGIPHLTRAEIRRGRRRGERARRGRKYKRRLRVGLGTRRKSLCWPCPIFELPSSSSHPRAPILELPSSSSHPRVHVQ